MGAEYFYVDMTKLTVAFRNFVNVPTNVEHKRNYSWTAVSTDSVSAVPVIRSWLQPERKMWKIKEINGS